MKDLLQSIWKKQIKAEYDKGNICSESHLQAEIFHHLRCNDKFCQTYRIFVEPREPHIHQKMGIIPDMVIIRESKIVAAIELKYVPNAYAKFKKDIRSLLNLYNLRGSEQTFSLKTNPKNGNWSDERFTIAEDALLVYGIITKSLSAAITNPESIWLAEPSIKNAETVNYLQLVGSINKGSESEFY